MTVPGLAAHLHVSANEMAGDLANVVDIVEGRAASDLRARLGTRTSLGAPVDLPLTDKTVPRRSRALVQALYRLAEGFYRLRQGENEKILEVAEENWERTLDAEFGWASGSGYLAPVTLEQETKDGTMTVSAAGWYPEAPVQTPAEIDADVVSDKYGSWSAAADPVEGPREMIFRQYPPRHMEGGTVDWPRHQGPLIRRLYIA